MNWWLLLGFLLLGAAIAVRRSTGLPWARVVYTDTHTWQQPAQPLYARRYNLVGKPDYLIKRGRQLIPVEVKPGRRSQIPYDSDQMQLAAYCLLIEETTGRRPSFGVLRYADVTFKIPFDARRRRELLSILREMQAVTPHDRVLRSHDDLARCRGCGYSDQCEQSLYDGV
jgi:CRISPR-associated exonuclease Cas4